MSRKTRERKQREMAEAKEKKRFVNRWEFRAMRNVSRVIAYLFLLAYLGLAGSLTWTWIQHKWVRSQPIERAIEVAQESLYSSPQDAEKLRKWLAMRPYSEGEKLIKMMEPFAGRMSGMTFLVYSGWLVHENKMDDATFWRQYARFRIRYDAVRCGSYDAVDLLNEILGDVPQPAIQQYMAQHPNDLPKMLLRVLEYDKNHPAENNPAQFCEDLTKSEEFRTSTKVIMTKPEEWPGIYGSLRGTTKAEILGMILEQKRNGTLPDDEKEDKDKDKDKGKDKPCPPQKGKKPKPGESCAGQKEPDKKETGAP